MGKLTKILSPLVAVLAILAAVISFLTYQDAVLYQARATKLADGLVKTTKKLDEGTQSGKGNKLTFTPATGDQDASGSLTIEEYEKDPAAFENTVKEGPALAEIVVTQRDKMAETISSVSKSLGVDEGSILEDDLKAAGTYDGKLSLAISFSEAVTARKGDIWKGIESLSKDLSVSGLESLDSSITIDKDEEDKMTAKYSGSEINELFRKMGKNVNDIKETRNTYENWLRKLNTYVKKHNWSAKTSSIQGNTAKQILEVAKQDLEKINGKLIELESVKKELTEKQDELHKCEEKINKLKEEGEKLAKDLKDARERIRELGGEDDGSRPILDSIDQINPKIVGYVLVDNSEWNYIICDLSNKDVVKGVRVIISDDTGNHLASGIVSKAEEKISIIEISKRRSNSIPKGAKVYMGKMEGDEND